MPESITLRLSKVLKHFEARIKKVGEDIYKNLVAKGICTRQSANEQDIVQQVKLVAMELYLKWRKKRKAGITTKKFELRPGYLYKHAYFNCIQMFIGSARSNPDFRIYYKEHDELIRALDEVPMPTEEDLDELEKNERKIAYLLSHLYRLGVQVDEELGMEFALWWMGLTVREISLALKAAAFKRKRATSTGTVSKRLTFAFEEIRIKTGITQEQLTILRDYSLNRERIRKRGIDYDAVADNVRSIQADKK